MAVIIILIFILATSLFIIISFKDDHHNKKVLLITYLITLVGTFAGVFLAAKLAEHQVEAKERQDLFAMLNQAHIEADSATYMMSDYYGSILSELNDNKPLNKPDIAPLKEKLSKGAYPTAVRYIESIKGYHGFNKLLICESLYSQQISYKYIPTLCRSLNFQLFSIENNRNIIITSTIPYSERLQAIKEYLDGLRNIETILKLAHKSLKSKLTKEEISKVEALAGCYRTITGSDGKAYNVSPFEQL